MTYVCVCVTQYKMCNHVATIKFILLQVVNHVAFYYYMLYIYIYVEKLTIRWLIR